VEMASESGPVAS